MTKLSKDVVDGSANFPTRRQVLSGIAAGGVATLAAPFIGSGSARAQGKEVVMSMSGGSFMDTWQNEIIKPFTEKTGISVRMTPGNLKAHAAALLASGENARPFDLFIGQADDFVRLIDANVMAPVTADLVPSLADVDGKFKDHWDGFASMFDYFSVGLSYDAQALKEPPASWAEFVERTAKGDFGKQVFFTALSTNVAGPEVLANLSRALSGSVDDRVEAGFDAVRRMKSNIFKFYQAQTEPVVFLTGGEGLVGPALDGRSYVAHDETNGKVGIVKPAEGPASNGPSIGVVQGGNEEGAYQLLEHALSAEIQKAFCDKMFYGSVNSKVVYSPKLADRIPKVGEIFIPDPRRLAANVGAWTERWNREILT